MAFTYGGDPANSALEAIRFVLDDTDSTDYEFEDAEITYAINIAASSRLAAASLAGVLAMKYAKRAKSERVGQTAIDYRDRAKELMDLQAGLLDGSIGIFSGEDGSGFSPDLTVGGVSEDELDTLESDSDAIGLGLEDDGFHWTPDGRWIWDSND